MNVTILILLTFLGSCSAKKLLSTSDLGNIFIKYAHDELPNSDVKVMENILRLHRSVWDSAQTIFKPIQCFVCRSGFFALIALINFGVPDAIIVNIGTKICTISMSTPRVCRGFIELYMPTLKYIIKTTPEAAPKTFCGILLQGYRYPHICSYDDPRFEWEVKLPPKTNVERVQRDFADPSPLTVAILSDVHIDPYYEPFGVADCSDPVCCRKGQEPRTKSIPHIDEELLNKVIIEANGDQFLDVDIVSDYSLLKIEMAPEKHGDSAGYWGDYRNCDTPIWAYTDIIQQIASHKDLDVVYYIGDNIDHHGWETTYKLNNEVNSMVINKMKQIFESNVIVVPTMGNHDSHPPHQFAPLSIIEEGLNTTWLYESLAEKWSYYLTKSASRSVRHRGGFSMLIRPGLRVISLNNNVAYKYNWWLLYDPLNSKIYLEWLVDELHKAELSGERVHILSHIPAGDQDLTHTWSREYHRIVERFSSTITAQFSGHLHTDEFKVFYSEDRAINVAWGAGSGTTFQNLNLNYKIVTFDRNSFEPTSMVNYIYNLTESNLTPLLKPRWYTLYDMKQAYQLKNLTPAAMDELVVSMVTKKKYLLDQYVSYAWKVSDSTPSCNVFCELEYLCNAVTSVLWERTKCIELKILYFLT